MRTTKAGRIRNDVRDRPDRPDRQVRRRAADRAPGRCHDPEASGEQDRPHDDARRVEDRRERIEQEPPVRDEDLAERDRRREHHLRETVDAQELDVQILGRRIEPFGDDARQPRCGDEDADAGDRHQADRAGQHGATEVVRRFVAVVVAEPAVDRHERGGQPGRDQDVEGDLRDAERGVVGVELGAGPVRVGEDPVADDPGREVAERQDRQQDRAAREDPVEEAAGGRDGGGHARTTVSVSRRGGPGVACRGSWPRARPRSRHRRRPPGRRPARSPR